MKILILTDSLSLPRKDNNEIVSYEDTYPSLLKKKNLTDEVLCIGIGGATLDVLRTQASYYVYFNPDIVIIQCGIVDCAPRAFSKLEVKIIGKLGIFNLLKNHLSFLRKIRGIKYTSKRKFYKEIETINNKVLNTVDVFTIGILPASVEYEKKVPGITNAIKEYNAILEANTNFVAVTNFPKEGVLKDQFHLNKIGHQYIYQKLIRIIQNTKANR